MKIWTPAAIEAACCGWTTPPRCQGQIVEVSYGCCADGAFQRVFDHSDRSVSYSWADWSSFPEEEDAWDPVNREPVAEWIGVPPVDQAE